MALPKRPTELLQHVIGVFKGFEKKLDKLQDDVNNQGQTLSELRVMVAKISGLSDIDVRKQSPKKVNAVQHEVQTHGEESCKMRKKIAMPPFPSKLKAKSLPVPKFTLRMSETNQKYMKKAQSSPIKGLKQSSRLSKAEAPRKATTLRTQKNKMDKPRNKPKK